ncbi:MAG: ATP-binding protein [Thermodesulfobacteriota bacterium]
MKTAPDILIIEDSEDDARLLVRELERRGLAPAASRVETEGELRRRLDEKPWDLVISDYTLPKIGGVEALGVVREAAPGLPVIVVSGKTGEEAAVAVMKAGASDYITKDNLSRLAPAVERELREVEVRVARATAEKENRLLNRLLQTIFEINKVIVRELDPSRLLGEVCRILVEHGGFDMAWIGMVVPDGSVEPVARAGEGGASATGPGPGGISRKAEACGPASWSDPALCREYRSSASFPLRDRSRVVGSINVYSAEPAAFGEKMTELLDDLAGDIGFALQVMDVAAERRRAESALLESNERFCQLFEQNEDALMLIRSDLNRIIDSNPAAESLFGFTRYDHINRCLRFFDPAGWKGFQALLTSALREGSARAERLAARRKDGLEVTVSVRAKKIRLRDDYVILCTFKDMTRIIGMEEEAKAIQAKLIHANKMTSLGTLASGLAHEINNPNNFIMSNSALLLDAWGDTLKVLDSYWRENGDFLLGGLPFSEMKLVMEDLLTGICDGSRRIKGIIDNLKDFSRMDISAPDGTFDVNRAVRASVDILASQIKGHTDNFHVSYGAGLPEVRGSLQKIEQVVMNLVLNSLHALGDRTRGLWVETSSDGEGKMVVIKITDEGRGIPTKFLDRVTDPFFTTRSLEGGTGLGLSISYSIVKEHKGSLELTSSPGRGTTATVNLPSADFFPASPAAMAPMAATTE